MEPQQTANHKIHAGLCEDCVHARRIVAERGSVFLGCELGLTDPKFPKYPRLPVLTCSGYERKPDAALPAAQQ